MNGAEAVCLSGQSGQNLSCCGAVDGGVDPNFHGPIVGKPGKIKAWSRSATETADYSFSHNSRRKYHDKTRSRKMFEKRQLLLEWQYEVHPLFTSIRKSIGELSGNFVVSIRIEPRPMTLRLNVTCVRMPISMVTASINVSF